MQLSLFEGLSWLKNPYALIDQYHEIYGQNFYLKLPFMSHQLVTGDPKLIKHIISDKSLSAGRAIQFLKPLIGKHSIIMLDGEIHSKRHQYLASYFFSNKIKHYDQLLINNINDELNQFFIHQSVSIHQLSQDILLNTIVKIIFGNHASKALSELITTIKELYRDCASLSLIFIKLSHLPLGKFTQWGKFKAHMYSIRNLMTILISTQCYITDKNCLLYHLLIEQNCQYTQQALLDELVALLLFGHDTASATLAWSFFHLYQNSFHLEEVLSEINDSAPHIENRILYPKLFACLQESMRLRPVVVHLSRIANKPHSIENYQLKQNQRVLPSSYLAHHNKAVFDKPNEYCPHRFHGGKDYPYSYFPFGFGNRVCIGKILAQRQMQIMMAEIMKRIKLKLITPSGSSPQRHLVIMAPPEGGKFIIEKIFSRVSF